MTDENSTNTTSGTTSASGGSQLNRNILDGIQIPLFSLTVLFALNYIILILSRRAFRQNKLNWFTMNICLTSAIFCLDMLVMNIERLLNISNNLSCRVQGFFVHMSVCQLMYSHCVAALCRLLAVVYAQKRLFRSIGFALSCIVAGWLVALLTALPYLFIDGFSCHVESKSPALSYYTLMSTLVVPIIIIGASDVRILIHVRQSSRQVQEGHGRNRASNARDIHLLKVLVGTFIVFVVGWTPLFVIQAFGDLSQVPSSIDALTQMLPPLAILLDVMLLIYTNQPVRLYLKEWISRRIGRIPKARVHTVHPTNLQKT